MNFKVLLLVAFIVLYQTGFAQLSNIVAGEYFFESDPGFGAATPLPAFTANQNVDLSFLASTSGVPKGMRTLGIRVRDSNNVWSMPMYTLVYVTADSPGVIENISGAEYFFDNDPGVASATAIAIGTAAPVVDVTFAANSAGLSVGMHIFGLRIRNAFGEWGMPSYTPIYVDRSRTITKLEYFFDTDPGIGNGTEVAITPATNSLDADFVLNTSSLSPATHTLGVRVAGDNDFWGIAETVDFVICATGTPKFSADVACEGSPTTFKDGSDFLPGDVLSWDFDSDGKEDATGDGDQAFTYPAAGGYTATLTLDRSGCLASTSVPVSVDEGATVSLALVEPVCQSDDAAVVATVEGGGVSKGTWSTSGDGVFNNASLLDTDYEPGPIDAANGSVTVTFTTEKPEGACLPAVASTIITVELDPTADAGGVVNICGGSSVTLAGSIGGSASSAVWTTTGDGTFDDQNLLSATYTPGPNDVAGGRVDLWLTTDDPPGSCGEGDDEMVLLIATPPNVNAGPDLSICGNAVATLGATVSGTTGVTWTTAGDGSFDSPNSLDPDYTPGPGDIVAGSVLVMLTSDPSGVCPSQNDEVTIVFTKDIIISAQSVSTRISQNESVDLESGGTFNIGDVLSATILASATKGIAQVVSGSVLQYHANNGTVGRDSVEVRICNQCNQCDAAFIVFNIQNEPPVINIPAIQTTSGNQVVIPVITSVIDLNQNIDPSSIVILQAPLSGASAAIDASFNLVLDYGNVPFAGTDQLTVQVCDDLGICTQHVVMIEVGPLSTTVEIYNAIAPNSSGDNRFMRIMNLPEGNKVSIYNRWGDRVFSVNNYNNDVPGRRFEGTSENGKALPTGVYFYRIEIPGKPLVTGYLSLRQ
jgi:hypothetical protein